MARTPFQAPNLANATPEMLIDESAKLSLIENYAKKLRKFYREALFARLQIDTTKEVKAQDPNGETFIAHIEQYGQDRFDSKTFRADHPELYAKYCRSLSITKMTYEVKAPAVQPELKKLMDELRAELGLDDDEP